MVRNITPYVAGCWRSMTVLPSKLAGVIMLPMLYFYVSVGLLRMISAQAERKMSGKRKKAAPWMKREATFFVKILYHNKAY